MKKYIIIFMISIVTTSLFIMCKIEINNRQLRGDICEIYSTTDYSTEYKNLKAEKIADFNKLLKDKFPHLKVYITIDKMGDKIFIISHYKDQEISKEDIKHLFNLYEKFP